MALLNDANHGIRNNNKNNLELSGKATGTDKIGSRVLAGPFTNSLLSRVGAFSRDPNLRSRDPERVRMSEISAAIRVRVQIHTERCALLRRVSIFASTVLTRTTFLCTTKHSTAADVMFT